jgi:ABC-type multidrug transport system permease subunit
MVQPRYDMSRLIFYRESASKTYSQFAFSLSMVVAEMPYSILCAVCFFLPLYYIPGFQSDSSRAGYQFFIILITEIFSVTLGQMISALTPNSLIASQMNPPITIIFSLFCGVAIPKPQMPGFWRAWLYQLDPFTRLIGGMVVTELHGRDVVCSAAELNHFTAPSNLTCGEYMKPFFERGGNGYLVDEATQACKYCAYKIGDQFYAAFSMHFDHRWRDLGIFAAFIGSNLIILFLAVSGLAIYQFESIFRDIFTNISLTVPLPQLQPPMISGSAWRSLWKGREEGYAMSFSKKGQGLELQRDKLLIQKQFLSC